MNIQIQPNPHSGDMAYRTRTVAVDRSFMNCVYMWMTGGLLVSGLVAFFVSVSPALIEPIMTSGVLRIGLIIAQIGAVVYLAARIEKMSLSVARFTFILYAALTGYTLSTLVMIYTQESLFMTFIVASGTFGLTSTWAYVTKRDLTRMGSILFMALIGLVFATIVNMFWANSTLYWLITYAGVLIFVGLTAYDTQRLKNMAETQLAEGERGQKYAILGALALYLDFINLFLLLLRIMDSRR